jgi:hypothetical protein
MSTNFSKQLHSSSTHDKSSFNHGFSDDKYMKLVSDFSHSNISQLSNLDAFAKQNYTPKTSYTAPPMHMGSHSKRYENRDQLKGLMKQLTKGIGTTAITSSYS